jgi:hypothetical protein
LGCRINVGNGKIFSVPDTKISNYSTLIPDPSPNIGRRGSTFLHVWLKVFILLPKGRRWRACEPDEGFKRARVYFLV